MAHMMLAFNADPFGSCSCASVISAAWVFKMSRTMGWSVVRILTLAWGRLEGGGELQVVVVAQVDGQGGFLKGGPATVPWYPPSSGRPAFWLSS